MNSIPELPFVREFIRLCSIGDAQGFHERNGGNLTYHLRPAEARAAKALLKGRRPSHWQDVELTKDVAVPAFGGECFLATGSGKFFRNASYDPEVSIALCELDKSGARYRILWGLRDGGRPTSEFSSHLMNLEVKERHTDYWFGTDQQDSCYVCPLNVRAFTRALWNTMTECPVVFPEGVGVVKWMVPGCREIAVITSKLMEKYNNVVWAHHGLFCAADSFDNAMGQMETIEKAAKIHMLVLASGRKPVSGITPAGYRAIARRYSVPVAERFL